MALAAAPNDTMTTRLDLRRIALLASVAALVLLVALWDWNWFRGLIERQAATALGREMSLGHFDADLSLRERQLSLFFDDLSVANPEGFSGNTAHIAHLQLVLSLRGLMSRQLRIERLALDSAQIELERKTDGRDNWQFAFMHRDEPPASKPWQLEIADVAITEGRVHLLDPVLHSDFTLKLRTEGAGLAGQLLADIDGTYQNQAIKGHFRGDSALTLRTPERPYALQLELVNGRTQLVLAGTLLRPLEFGGAAITLDLRGDNLADLYALTTLPLPPTAPYRLRGALDYVQNDIRFSRLQGSIGSSDLSGDFRVRMGGVRPLIIARLLSQRVVLADLGGFIGATPGAQDAANDTRALKRERAKKAAGGRVLPDTPLNLPKLRAADVRLSYAAAHIEGAAMPFDQLAAQLDIVDGRIALQPLSFAVGDGQIVLNLDLDAAQDTPTVRADIDLRRVDLRRLTQASTLLRGEGRIGGRARIDTRGNSLAQMLGRGDGGLQLFMGGGNLRALLIDLAGLDLGNALLSALGLPKRTDLHCLIADFGLQRGVLGTRTFIIDTGQANLLGEGRIDFGNETLDYRLHTQPKQPSVAALSTPIRIGGTFADPKVRPEMTELGLRTGAAVALGVFLTPLAALLPTLQLGLGEDHNCEALIAEVRR